MIYSFSQNPSLQRMIWHVSALKLLLFFGLLVECPAIPTSNGSLHVPTNFRHAEKEEWFFRPKSRAISKTQYASNGRVCNGVLCDDGRCVSSSWFCSETDLEASSLPNSSRDSDLWKRRSTLFHYGMTFCGLVAGMTLILICMCAIEEEEFASQNFFPSFDSKYVPKKTNEPITQSKVSGDSSSLFKSSESGKSDKIETVPDVKIVEA